MSLQKETSDSRYIVSGNKIVDAIHQINFEGNTIPQSWFQQPVLKLDSGRPNLCAIILLADIIYWYRPTVVRHEVTGQIVEIKKKFARHRLYKDYRQWGEQFGFSKRQVQDAIAFLVERGLIVREVTNLTLQNGMTLGSVVFLEPIVDTVRDITFNVRGVTLKSDPPPANETPSQEEGGGVTPQSEGGHDKAKTPSPKSETPATPQRDHTQNTSETSSETTHQQTHADALAADADVVDVENSSFSSSENEPLPMAVTTPVPDDSSEPKNADAIASRLIRWAEADGQTLTLESARRIATLTKKAGAAVADLGRVELEARLRDYKALKLPKSIHGTVADKLKRDTEYLRWVLWLWPLHLIDLGAWAKPGATGGPNLCAVFVARAGLAKEGEGEKSMSLPGGEYLAALLNEDAGRVAAIEREKRDEREREQRAREREEREAVDAEIAELSVEDRRALIDKATSIVPDFAGLTREGGKPNAAVVDEMRALWSSGWTPEQNRRSATILRADAPTADFVAALEMLEPAAREAIEAEARESLAALKMPPEAIKKMLSGRCQSVMIVQIKAGAEFMAPVRDAQKRAA